MSSIPNKVFRILSSTPNTSKVLFVLDNKKKSCVEDGF